MFFVALMDKAKLKSNHDKWVRNNKERNAAHKKKWLENNPEKRKVSVQKYDDANKDKKHARYQKNKVEQLAQQKLRYNENKEEILKQQAEYYEANRDKILKRAVTYAKNNPAKINASNAKHRASKLDRTPVWADLEAIKDVYKEAQYFQMDVDHIIPLQGKLVSGLHVWDNLQLLSPKENRTKSNKFTIEDRA